MGRASPSAGGIGIKVGFGRPATYI